MPQPWEGKAAHIMLTGGGYPIVHIGRTLLNFVTYVERMEGVQMCISMCNLHICLPANLCKHVSTCSVVGGVPFLGLVGAAPSAGPCWLRLCYRRAVDVVGGCAGLQHG